MFCTLLFSSTVLAKPKIKQCSTRQTSELKKIRSYLKDNLKTIMKSVSDLTDKEKKRLRKKIKNINFKCLDDKKVCKDHGRYGVSRNLFKTAIVICYDYHRKHKDEAYCELTDTVLHETAHASRVEKSDPHKPGDRVWRVGRAARKLCREDNLDRALK
jgi:hypothetical protein